VTKLGQVDTKVTLFKAACLREFGHRTFSASTWLYVRLKHQKFKPKTRPFFEHQQCCDLTVTGAEQQFFAVQCSPIYDRVLLFFKGYYALPVCPSGKSNMKRGTLME
jgi:hypothetical protein